MNNTYISRFHFVFLSRQRGYGRHVKKSTFWPPALNEILKYFIYFLGDTLHLSDIDMIAGTPVLDIKPYIPEYDSLNTRTGLESNPDLQTVSEEKEANISSFHLEDKTPGDEDEDEILHLRGKSEAGVCLTPPQTQFFLPKEAVSLLKEVESYANEADLTPPDCEERDKVSDCGKTEPAAEIVDRPSYGSDSSTTIADWIREPPVSSLDVRFTPQAQKQLEAFLPCDRPRFKFLRSPEEAGAAIRAVLSADPRSVYRRTRCRDRLFFFSLDTVDVTCWFGQGFAEVLEIRPVGPPGPEEPSNVSFP
uniref:tRNA methyltransferase O n=1 Tax=Poecilia latipinna TaxID=48699 RepID=A0A3B3U501_9TELE